MIKSVLLLAVVAACHASSGTITVVSLDTHADFAHRIHRIRVRTGDADALWMHNPAVTGVADPLDATTYEQGAPQAIERVLRAKGYDVTIVWDDPWSYGRARTNPHAEGVRGYPLEVTSFSPATSLAADEAFLELVTTTDTHEYTTQHTYETEREVGRVTDASGNTVARIHEPGTETRTTTQRKNAATATAQLFIAGQPHAVYYEQAWTGDSAQIVPVIEKALAAIPPRAH